MYYKFMLPLLGVCGASVVGVGVGVGVGAGTGSILLDDWLKGCETMGAGCAFGLPMMPSLVSFIFLLTVAAAC